MPSIALGIWQNDRMPRLAGIDAQCAAAVADEAAKTAASVAAATVAGVAGASAAVISVATAAATDATAAVRHLEECLRGYVMHLSAHFQGFCRDLYTECSQICSDAVAAPPGMAATMQRQFAARLYLEQGNPNHENLVKDFNRFGFVLNFTAPTVAAHAANGLRVTHLGHRQAWRNRAVHQGTSPLGGGVPADLTLPLLQMWQASCHGLAGSLDDIMYNELSGILGRVPW